MAAPPELNEDQKRVLAAVAERANDGYSLISRTGLTLPQLEQAIQKLVELRLVSVDGEIHGDQIGKAYFWVAPDAQGKADFLLGKLVAY